MFWETIVRPTTLAEALEQLARYGDTARVVAGGTDVLVELQRGVKPTRTLIDITGLAELRYLREEQGVFAFGALTTHNDIVMSAACRERLLPLAQACWEVGAPQIRNRATLAGNLITASPANDSIAPLMALGAEVVLCSKEGERVVALDDFYAGFRRTVLRPGELLREIRVPALREQQRGLFLKLGLRGAQAISVIDVAFVLTFDGPRVSQARITLGCLAPTVVHARSVETYLQGKELDAETCQEAGRIARQDVTPIGDVRASAEYRYETLQHYIEQGLRRIAANDVRDQRMDAPVALDTGKQAEAKPFTGTIETTVNGKPCRLVGAERKTLLNALREDAGLTGTKEGCAEGECGACTVWLNGQAVMSCLVPAAQAHGAEVTTIEGLADGDTLHPLQQAFVDCAAVQCGFCIPGMLMAGAKLLDECPHPDLDQVRVALSGNICRCTGYSKILDAVQAAAQSDLTAGKAGKS
uniref:Uncharacterized protein n=1 Tax=Thermosporothrix sp. COM3 TaxID=2490863 RepID=A0A455SFX8_9CHLR|nr:hypothetical protein KTC_10090 [Thermosporothrix sp. COM3]